MKFKYLKLILLFIASLIIPWGKTIAGDIDHLVENLQSSDRQTRLLAVEELGRIGDGKAVDALLNLVITKAEDWRIKIRAVRLLGEIADPGVSEVLVRVFNDPFLNEECPAMKWDTAIALGKDFNKGSRAVPFLIPVLNDKNFAIKFGTIKALGNIGDPQAIPFLKQIAKNDNDPYIKGEALSVLKKFSSREKVIGYKN